MPILIHVTLCLLLCAILVTMATGDLVHVSVLFRHGHRSPVKLLPSENYTVRNTWLDGLGQLTNIGKQNEFELGQFLRKRYGSVLGSRYNSSDHFARSTDVDRTLMSAQACLAGLFPPLGDQQWSSQLLWQPIPVHTRPQAEDWLLASPEFPCSERDRQFSQMRSDPRRLAFYGPHADFLRRLSAGSGMTVTPDNVHTVLDTLWIDRIAKLPGPEWLNASSDWQRLVTVGSYQWQEYSWTSDLVRFGSGVLLDEILATMSAVSEGRSPSIGRKLRIYSDHDTTVASALAALGSRDFVWPNFASCLMFELHSTADAGFAVQIWFRNDTALSPLLIRLANCSDMCPLTRTLDILAPMRLTRQQLLASCQGNGGIFMRWTSRMTLLALASCLLLGCCCLTALAFCRCYFNRRRSAVVYRSLSDDLKG